MVSWIVENWRVLAEVVFALLTVAGLITGLTNTPKDDEIVRKIVGFLGFLKPADQPGTVKLPLTRVAPPSSPSPAPLFRSRPDE